MLILSLEYTYIIFTLDNVKALNFRIVVIAGILVPLS